jgi:hypothetical protein
MKGLYVSCIVGVTAALALVAICQIATRPRGVEPPRGRATGPEVAPAKGFVAADFDAVTLNLPVLANLQTALAGHQISLVKQDDTTGALPAREAARLQNDSSPLLADPVSAAKAELPYLAYYVYSEVPPAKKPADVAVEALSGIPLGTPLEEIKRAADAFGLDFTFMKAVAKIESGFDPNQRTGSYIGLFQLSRDEFAKYGSGDIINPRDNAIAAAYKFINEAAMFEWATHKKPSISDLYLIHQQGWQGAAEHVSHPERVAWKSMCATDEGVEKGERWCKRAIWGNTLPAIKHVWASVDRLTSGAFVAMWRDRVNTLYARYSDATSAQAAQ